MNRLKAVALIACATVLAVTSVIYFSPGLSAQSASLTLTTKKNYTIEPGKSINDTLVIRNNDKEDALDLTLRVVDFSYTDDSGAPKLMMAEDAPQTTWSLKPFMSVPESVSIEPGESRTLDMSIAIPANQGAGSYYSAIVYSSGSADGGNVGLSASGVTLVFTTIPGEVNENLILEKIGAYRKANTPTGGEFAYFHTVMPETIAYRIKNEGNVAESPVGTITLKPLFGEEIPIQNINPAGSLALLEQTRTFTTCIKLKNEEDCMKKALTNHKQAGR